MYLRVSHDFKEKLEVIEYHELHGMSATLDKFYPGTHGNARRAKSKKIRDWLKLRFQVEEIGQSSRSNLRKARAKGVGASLSPETEDNIVQWVKDMRDDDIPVATIMLQLKARDLAQEQGISTDQFKASKDWANSFRNRHGFTLRQKTRQGQDKEDGAQIDLEKFSDRVRTIIQTHNIKKVFNANQTGVNYEYLPKTTVHPRGAKTVWIRCGGRDKDRATAMLLGDSEGRKYPVFVVLKQRKSTVAATVKANMQLRHGFGVHVWKDVEPLMEQWPSLQFLRFHFGNRSETNEKVLLLWDDFSGHFTPKVQAVARELNVLLEKVPPRFTWICQPADVAWNKPFKSQLRWFWINSLMAQLEAHRCAADESVIVNGFRKTKLLFDDLEAPDVDSADTTDDALVDMLAQTMGHLHVVNDCMVSSRMSVFD
ncbi:Aste57867_3636 [Aphanomyces stellatus]|uniref:Aste57867_3636 protein n=1 Tax=Aphanomyces stellatus TaxID=120398 RepID=A0A485KFU3_9STRA|nr:hypothetical protein As57867_003625 [Aphanomyces stellatus]VFT80793.1 Aste57867_3636 [Aphanomyces stellatus]